MQTIGTLDEYQRLLPDNFNFMVSSEPDSEPGRNWRASIIHDTPNTSIAAATGYGGTVENAINEAMHLFINRMTTQALGAMSTNHVPKKVSE